jgi:hypothetical protein
VADHDSNWWQDPPFVEQLSIVEYICRRPDCYTKHGTIEEVAAFLEGYRIGLTTGAAHRRTGLGEITEFDRFFELLKNRLQAGNRPWSDALREYAADDESGLQYLADTAREFRKRHDKCGDSLR